MIAKSDVLDRRVFSFLQSLARCLLQVTTVRESGGWRSPEVKQIGIGANLAIVDRRWRWIDQPCHRRFCETCKISVSTKPAKITVSASVDGIRVALVYCGICEAAGDLRG